MSSVGDVRLSSSRKSESERNPFAQRCGLEEVAVGSEKDHPIEPARLADYRSWKFEVHAKECRTLERLVGRR